MSRRTMLVLGIFTILPMPLLVVSAVAGGLVHSFGLALASATAAILIYYAGLVPIYLVHSADCRGIHESKRRSWRLMLVFVGPVAMPLYWHR